MLDRFLHLGPRAISFDIDGARKKLRAVEPLAKPNANVLEEAKRSLGLVPARNHEITSCSPVIPHAELQRIRDNVVNQFSILRNNYSNIGSSLDARGFMAQYQAVFDATEGGNYCYYTSDQHLVDDIVQCAQSANAIYNNAGTQYANNFASRMSPLRAANEALKQAAAAASNDIGPTVDAYKQVASSNFDFHLYHGMNGTLDNLLAEYQNIISGAGPIFDQAAARVQANFEAEVKNNNVIYSAFLQAYKVWDEVDGAQGFAAFFDQFTPFRNSLVILNRFVVLDTPLNRQIFAEIKSHINDVQVKWNSFPNYPEAMATTGFILDPNTSSLKFYARQLVLNTAQGIGAYFNSTIAKGESLIGTGFSYQHGGRMPPHKGHKDGKECDIYSDYFKVGGANYSQDKSTKTVIWLLQNKVTRVIYTNPTVVNAANTAVPTNAVAKVLPDHETHIHFDMDNATATVMADV
jgi:hypothetical protein